VFRKITVYVQPEMLRAELAGDFSMTAALPLPAPPSLLADETAAVCAGRLSLLILHAWLCSPLEFICAYFLFATSNEVPAE